jgi:hypothetical protein
VFRPVLFLPAHDVTRAFLIFSHPRWRIYGTVAEERQEVFHIHLFKGEFSAVFCADDAFLFKLRAGYFGFWTSDANAHHADKEASN